MPIVGAGVAKGLLKEPVQQAGKGTVEAVKQQAKKGALQPKLPILDKTGKVHGELPSPQKLGDYPREELIMLRDELKESVKVRIKKNNDYGYDPGHGQRQAAEQDLIKSITKHLED